MNKFVLSALALAVASSTGFAGTGTSAWSATDQQINSLGLSMGPQGGAPAFGALIRSSFDYSTDDAFAQTPGENALGLRAQDARLWASGNVADYMWRLSFDFAGATSSGGDGIGTAALQDAYARWNCTDQLWVMMGQFKANVARSASTPAGKLLFIDRSFIGQVFDGWDVGIGAGGSLSQITWDVAVQNGTNGVNDESAVSARVAWDMNNNMGVYEGGYDAPQGTNLAVGVSYFSEQNYSGDPQAVTIDASATMEGFSIGAELSDMDEELVSAATTPNLLGTLFDYSADANDDATPWAVTVGYMLRPNEWEVAGRFQDVDDDDDTTSVTLGVNWYQAGHAAKWSFNVEDRSSDLDAIEGTIYRVGLSIGADG